MKGTSMKNINLGLIGAGTVGGGVVKMLHEKADFLTNNLGLPVVLKRIADKDASRFGNLPIGKTICSGNASDVLNDEDIQVVIELVGGTTFAKDLIMSALEKGKHVITANKALIAEYGPVIFELAEKKGLSVGFEASVGGGMPVIKAIRESLIADKISW
jgi:homoserine dehydrogenase